MSNIIIASITMLGTGLAMVLGRIVACAIPASVIDVVGGLVIIGIGVLTVMNAVHALRPMASVAQVLSLNRSSRTLHALFDIESRSAISTREVILLGIALTCNNVATGVGAGASGISPLVTAILSGVFSLLCVGGGCWLGATAGARLIGRFAPLVAGITLVGLGIALVAG
jgi:putative sporulation protein YtaF